MSVPDVSSNTTTCLEDEMTDVYHRQEIAIIPTTVVLSLSVLTYGLRIIARLLTKQRIWWDDLLMGMGLILSLEPAVCQYLLVANGLGHHTCNVPAEQVARFIRIAFALQRANQPVLCCVKVSILLFYHRVFSNPGYGATSCKFRLAVVVGIVYTLLWGISTWIVTLTRCHPIELAYDWDMIKQQHLDNTRGTCRDPFLLGAIVAILSLVGDVYIIVLPLPVLMRLNINTRKKAAVIGIFLLGSFGCIASLVRIFEIATLNTTTTNDPTYTSVFAAAWTPMEQGIAIISGNLPMLSPLFRGYFNQPAPSDDDSSSSDPDPNNNNNGNAYLGSNGYGTSWEGQGTVSSNHSIINAAHRQAMGKFTVRQGGGKLRRLPREKKKKEQKQGAAPSLDEKDSSSTITSPSRESATATPDPLLFPSTTTSITKMDSTESYALRNSDTHLYVATISAEKKRGSSHSHNRYNVTSPLPPPPAALAEVDREADREKEREVSVWELFEGDGDLDARARTSCNAEDYHPLSSNRIHIKRQVTVVTSTK